MNNYQKLRSLCGMLFLGALLTWPMVSAPAAAGKVLIVSNKQKFGDPVVLRVAQVLRKDGNSVKVSIGTSLKGAQANKYGAVIIVNFIDDKRNDRSVTVFADEAVQKRIVLFNAVGDYLAPGKDGAGSTAVKSEKIVFDIVERVKGVLANQ